MMKSKYLMKGIALCAIAFAAASCSHDAWKENPNNAVDQTVKLYTNNFKTFALNGNDIDDAQTWSTAVNTQVTATANKTGVLKIYTANPIGNNVAPIYTANVQKGQTLTFTVSRPQDATTLHAAIIDANGSIEEMAFDATAEKAEVKFYDASSLAAKFSAPRRAIAGSHTFTDAPADADFATDYPANILDASVYYANYGTRNNYKLGDNATDINFWMGNANIYVKGTKTLEFKNPGDGTPGITFYILPNANVTFNGDFNYQKSDNFAMYIAPTAKVTFEGALSANVRIFNRGEIEVKGVTGPYAKGVIYNEGKITCDGNLSVFNADSEVENYGEMTVKGDVTVEGSGHIINGGTMNVEGLTLVNSNNCTWINDGTYTTENFTYNAGSTNVIDNCKLVVNDTFDMVLGDSETSCFQLDGGASVTTKYAKIGIGYIKMGAKSLFKVTDTAYMQITKATYGFYGVGNDYAVLEAENIVRGENVHPNQGFVVSYFGKIAVATNNHFANGYSDKSAEQQAAGEIGGQPYYVLGDNAVMAKSRTTAPVTIPQGKCSPGYNGGTPDPDPVAYTYFAFEDLGTSEDFDFNDIIVRVSAPNENGKCDIEFCAAGGTLQTYIRLGNTELSVDGKKEIHDILGINSETYQVERAGNTTQGLATPFFKIGETTLESGQTPADLDINIKVYEPLDQHKTKYMQRIITGPKAGETPFRIIVSGNDEGKWFWPKERVNIFDAYNGFGEWGANYATNNDWYKTITDESKVVKW